MFRLIALLLIPTLWGFGFLATRWGLMGAGPFWLTEWRFLLAAALAAPFFPWRRFDEWKAAWIAGLLLFAGIALQTVGLAGTTVAKSAFITATYAMFIPVIGAIFLRHRIMAAEWITLLVALLGVGLMCDLSLDALTAGDLYTIGCAAAFALHILWLDHCARTSRDLFAFGLAQVMTVGAIGLPFAVLFEGLPTFGSMSFLPVVGLLYLTVCSTLMSFALQPWVQRSYAPHVAGIVFLIESPVAALAAWVSLGESLTLLGTAGASLISLCALYLVWRTRERSPRPRSEAPLAAVS